MDFDHPPADPMPQVQAWLEEAKQTDLPNPNAMTLATVGPDGRPSARIVLLKHLEDRRVWFFTNYGSRKASEMEANPLVALLLHWDPLDRQVRLEGRVERTSESVSDAYFESRHPASRRGAIASEQSRPLPDRRTLERALAEIEQRYPGEDIPRPEDWGGYDVLVDRVELWQGRDHRLHDRVVWAWSERDRAWGAPQRLYP